MKVADGPMATENPIGFGRMISVQIAGIGAAKVSPQQSITNVQFLSKMYAFEQNAWRAAWDARFWRGADLGGIGGGNCVVGCDPKLKTGNSSEDSSVCRLEVGKKWLEFCSGG